jgi:hypothetical protein
MERWATDDEKARLARAIRDGLRFDLLSVRKESRWFPAEVNHPKKKRPFQAQEAWIFTASLLEDGMPVEVIRLKKPPGVPGWVLKVETREKRRIYIKLELTEDFYVLGRSFHYSDHDPKGEDDE